jgi:hypothetical protein
MPLNYLEEYFVDKVTGLPLAAGIVTFYKDQARTIKKPVYQLTGTAPNYTYTALANPLTLSAVGTFANDTGNDISVYAYPFDSAGSVELYYVTVTDKDGVAQFVREAVPNYSQADTQSQDLFNFMPNGQFLLHTDIPETDTTVAGEITAGITDIAYGGWTFERPGGSTATDIVTFERFNSAGTNPTGDPRYGLRVNCEIPGSGDTFKDIRVKFANVNKFSSATQEYTLSFTAKSNSGSSLTATANVYKYFGSDGPTATTTTIGTVSITTSYKIFNIPFVFGAELPFGTLDDDFVQVCLSLPNTISDITVTDFVLCKGNQVLTIFPDSTDSEFVYGSLAGGIALPAYDGSNIGLPLVLTKNGIGYDTSQIGKVYYGTYSTPKLGELACDGSMLDPLAKSSDGIPYSRLQTVLTNVSTGFPRFGTGEDFTTACILGISGNASLYFSNNKAGAAGFTKNGTPSTTCDIKEVHVGATDIGFMAMYGGSNVVYFWDTVSGTAHAAPSAGNSGFTVVDYYGNKSEKVPYVINSITTLAASGLASKYFKVSSTTVTYYFWFTVDGTGSDPAPGGTGVKVELTSGMTSSDVAKVLMAAATQAEATLVTIKAATSIPAGSYFEFSAVSNFYVWYEKAGAGTDPDVSGYKGIKVVIGAADTAAQVATATMKAINARYYALPDLRGSFIRIKDDGAGIDADYASRCSNNFFVYGDEIGSFQMTDNLSHMYHFNYDHQTLGNPQGSEVDLSSKNPGSIGGSDSRPPNVSLCAFIKY